MSRKKLSIAQQRARVKLYSEAANFLIAKYYDGSDLEFKNASLAVAAALKNEAFRLEQQIPQEGLKELGIDKLKDLD